MSYDHLMSQIKVRNLNDPSYAERHTYMWMALGYDSDGEFPAAVSLLLGDVRKLMGWCPEAGNYLWENRHQIMADAESLKSARQSA